MSTILVVDDMPIFRDPIAASLRLAGYTTLSAADGVEALQITQSKRPDLILLDISMPRMDGITFLKRLRAEPDIAPTKVILMTALSEQKQLDAASALGVTNHMLKSKFKLQDLLSRVRSLLQETSQGGAAGEPPPSGAAHAS